MRILGIDPGAATGALAVYDTIRQGPRGVADIPKLTRARGRTGTTSVVNAAALAKQIREWMPDQAVIERVNALPKQGATSGFQFGRSVGVVEGVLATLGIGLMEIEPVAWKRAVGLPFGADKEASRALAIRLYPTIADQLDRKKDNGRAEALLIAAAASRLW